MKPQSQAVQTSWRSPPKYLLYNQIQGNFHTTERHSQLSDSFVICCCIISVTDNFFVLTSFNFSNISRVALFVVYRPQTSKQEDFKIRTPQAIQALPSNRQIFSPTYINHFMKILEKFTLVGNACCFDATQHSLCDILKTRPSPYILRVQY